MGHIAVRLTMSKYITTTEDGAQLTDEECRAIERKNEWPEGRVAAAVRQGLELDVVLDSGAHTRLQAHEYEARNRLLPDINNETT